jgi:uncharacterized membrane protein
VNRHFYPSLPRLPHKKEGRFADAVTRFSGSLTFVNLHIVWFGAWVVFNLADHRDAFDPFPFGLLTLIVSLEAIFLSTFVLMSQNRQSTSNDAREVQDFKTDLYTQILLIKMAKVMGVDIDEVEEEAIRRLKHASLSPDAGA